MERSGISCIGLGLAPGRRVHCLWAVTIAVALSAGLASAEQAQAQGQSSRRVSAQLRSVPADPDDDDRLASEPTEPLAFDSVFSFGLGLWRTPALPRLLAGSDQNPDPISYRIDSANYRNEASAMALFIDARLFFPFVGSGLPLGLSILFSNALTEVPTLAFTTAGPKAPIRPKHSVGVTLGLRADLGLGEFSTESSLELAVLHIVYLGANLTAISPQVRFRMATDSVLRPWRSLGVRPLLAFEVNGSPYVMAKGFDNRITTESSGAVRSFGDIVQLSGSSTGWAAGGQIEGGVMWPRVQQVRDQSILLVWSYQMIQFNKVLDRSVTADDNSVRRTKLNASSVMNTFSVCFRSSFL